MEAARQMDIHRRRAAWLKEYLGLNVTANKNAILPTTKRKWKSRKCITFSD